MGILVSKLQHFVNMDPQGVSNFQKDLLTSTYDFAPMKTLGNKLPKLVKNCASRSAQWHIVWYGAVS